ncbi:MAG TPA: ABC transporter permease [Solirubrobacteraceae bacterium]|jgi:peptide/nickel transport system permease protein|nr:ABC transporter permease [Solirubrobacteraceae bacterium]
MSVISLDPGATLAEPRARQLRRVTRPPAGVVLGGGIVLVLVLAALLAPVIAPDSPTAGSVSQRLFNVYTIGHMLGTDGQGRDVLSRLIWGARPTLLAGVIPVVIGGLLGTALGMLAGLSRSWVRNLVMRTLDVLFAFPAILLAIAIGAALGPGIKNAIVSLSIVLIAPVARVAESEVLRLRSDDFMEAARASGARGTTIAWRHVVPNIAPPLLVYCTSLIGLAIVYAAGLAFLGLGVAPPHPDWGGMLDDLRANVFDRPVLSLVPAAAIFLASIGFNLLGSGLRRMLDVREREVAA